MRMGSTLKYSPSAFFLPSESIWPLLTRNRSRVDKLKTEKCGVCVADTIPFTFHFITNEAIPLRIASFFVECNRLCLRSDSLWWANTSASTAVDTLAWVDYIDVTCWNCLNWALVDTCTTCNARIWNFVSHITLSLMSVSHFSVANIQIIFSDAI